MNYNEFDTLFYYLSFSFRRWAFSNSIGALLKISFLYFDLYFIDNSFFSCLNSSKSAGLIISDWYIRGLGFYGVTIYSVYFN